MEIQKYKAIAPSTRVQYEGIYQRHIQPEFGRMRLKDIQPLQIRGKLVKLDKQGFGYETQNKVRILLLDMFDKAVLDNVAMKNPVRGIKVNRDVPMNRKCELALKKQLLQKRVVAGKNGAKPLKGFEDLIFTTKYDTPLNAQIYADVIKVIVEQMNLVRDDLEQFESFSGHCFRHTFAARCFEAGIQPKIVQKYLGHATLQMTMDLYTYVLETHLSDEMDKLDNRLEAIELSSDSMAEERYQKEREERNNIISSDKLIRIG